MRRTRFLFVGLGLVAAFVVAEIYLKYFTYKEINQVWSCYQPNLIMYMVYKPNANCPNRRYQEYDTVPRINNLGLRSDSNTTFEKPAGVKRILVLGDSLVAAHEVEEKETFIKLLENKLRQEGKYYEVLNGGIRGYSPLLSRFYLKYQGLKFEPDIVVLVVNTADVADDRRYLKYVKTDEMTGKYISLYPNWGFYFPAVNQDKTSLFLRNKTIHVKPVIRLSSAVINLIRVNIGAVYDRWLKWPFFAEDFVEGDWRTDALAVERQAINPSSYQELMELTQDNVAAIRQAVEKRGAKFYLVLSPMGHEVSQTEWDLGRLSWGAGRGKVYPTKALDDLGNWAKGEGIGVIDLKPRLKRAEGLKFFPKDGHLTVLGHERVFEGLWEGLKQGIN